VQAEKEKNIEMNWSKLICIILLIGIIFVGLGGTCSSNKSNDSSSGNSGGGSGDYTVYITATGTKYHTSTCQYVSQSKIAIKKSDAIAQGYTACSVCKP